MAGHQPKAPGWYPDPDILPGGRGRLRYWNGRHWTDRRRAMPILANLDLGGTVGLPQLRALEGPAHTAELPAPAAEITATRDGPGGHADTRDRPVTAERRAAELPAATGGGDGTPPQPPGPGGGGGGGGDGADGDDATHGTRPRTRKKWWVFAGVAVLAAIAVALAGEAMRPAPLGPRVLTDAQFVRSANADCQKTLPTLRPPDGGPMGSAVTPAQTADQADKAATGLDDLANRIGSLPAAAADQPHIAAWLDSWHRYAAAGHQYAMDLRVHGANGRAPKVLDTAATLAKSMDKFSGANGLTECEFAFAYNPDPSQF